VLAGLAYALTPYRLAQSDHLQVLMNGWMPIGLLGLHRYFASGSRRWLLVFAAAYLLTGLSNAYYLYFFLLPIAVVVGVELVRPRLPKRRILGDLSIAGVGIAAALAPVVFVYIRLQQEMRFTRDPNLLPGHSARLADYFRVAAGTWNWGGLMANGNGERQLFHGFAVIIFAVAGVCTVASRNRDEESADTRRRAVIAYGLIAALAWWLSIGPGPWRPYGLLFRFVPGFNGMRVPARLASVVILGLAVLAGAGFTWLFDRLPRRRAALAAIAVGAAIVFEGQHGIAVQEVPGWRDNNWDRVAYAWLRNSPPGAALELDITGMDYIRRATTLFQLHALEHRHPIVNGYSGWSTQLQELLGARRSPLHEPRHVAEVVRGLRRAGVRYVLLHEATFVEPEMARRIVGELQTADDQIAEAHEWPGTWVWRLKDIDPRPPPAPNLTWLDPKGFDMRASHEPSRLPLIFDANLDTRWLTGERQAGTEWIEVRLPRPVHLRRLEIVGGGRTVLDYPQRLRIDSTDSTGVSHVLFDDSVVEPYVESVAFNDLHPSVALDLPRNQTVVLRIQQTGRGANWWSIYELKLWEQKEER